MSTKRPHLLRFLRPPLLRVTDKSIAEGDSKKTKRRDMRRLSRTSRLAERRWYNQATMQHITIALPDELSAALAAPGQDLSRTAFEVLAQTAYRESKISAAQLRHVLGCETRMEVDAFLKKHGVELEYTFEDLERDRETHRQASLVDAVDCS